MKKITEFFFLIAAIAAWGNFANAQTSAYCNTPSGHFNDPNFAATDSHISLTITNVDANKISVKIEPRGAGKPIDFLQVNASGATPVIVGTDEGALLPEYVATINYTTPPTNITMTIFWSNPGWGGRWMIDGLTVPFSASCSSTPPPPAGTQTINFETLGHDWSWTIFENGDNAPTLYSVVPNPSSSSVNSSTQVAKFIVNSNGQPWAGAWSNDLPDFTFNANNCIVKVKVYKDVISDFTLKFENDNASVAFEKKVPNTVTNQWEELTFDFTSNIGSSVSRIVVIPDFPWPRVSGSINYFDDISFNNPSVPVVPTDPTTAAPNPPAFPANKVISLFSNAFANVPVDTWRTSWSNASFEQVNVAGNATLKYTSLVFVGAETTGPNLVNASGMTHFHLDYWTPDMTTFRVKLVDFGANGVWNGGGDDVEHEITITPVSLSQWNSFDVPLSNFTNLTTKANMAQFIFSGSLY